MFLLMKCKIQVSYLEIQYSVCFFLMIKKKMSLINSVCGEKSLLYHTDCEIIEDDD